MKSRSALLAPLCAAIVGCSDGSTSPGSAPESKPLPESLAAWAPTADPTLPTDAVLGIPSLGARWDSVVDLARHRAEVRKDLGAIFADWASRTPKATDWDTLSSQPQAGGTLHLVAFSVEGIAQGGLVWVPATPSPVGVVLFGHPSDGGVDDRIFTGLSMLMGSTRNQCIVVMPSFRGEPASMAGIAVSSDPLKASPWDRDVDDGLAMLRWVLEKSPLADPSRVVAVGYSRGAGVALLSALRDKRIRSVYEIAGPTDFFAPSIQNLSKDLAAGRSIDLPGLDALEAAYLAPFRAGRISADSLRTILLARSAARLAVSGLLPPAVAIHGTADTIVLPDQAAALKAADSRVDHQSIAGMDHTSMLLGADQPKVAQSLQAFLKSSLALP